MRQRRKCSGRKRREEVEAPAAGGGRVWGVWPFGIGESSREGGTPLPAHEESKYQRG